MTSPYAHFVRSVTLTLLLLVAACDQSDVTAPVTPPDPSAAIVDGSTDGDFDEFLFLPPLVKNPDLGSREPLSGLSPRIEICVLDGADCGSLFLSFEASEIVYDVDHYKVEWATDAEPAVVQGKTYRISVQLATVELGHVDITFESGGSAKNKANDETIELKDGRTVSIQFFLGTGLSEDDAFLDALCGVGPDCRLDVAASGQDNLFVTRDGDATLFIPDGALPPGEYQVLIRELFPCTLDFPADLPAGETLPEYDSCYEYTLTPDPVLLAEVTVAQCIDVDNVPDWQEPELQLGAQHPTPTPPGIDEFDLLPNVPAPAKLSCPDYVPGPAPPSLTTVSLLEGFGKGLLEFVFGEPLYAGHIGFGGTSRDLSKIKWVYPGIRVAGLDESRAGYSSIKDDPLAPAVDPLPLAPAMQSLVDTYGFVWRDVAPTLTADLFSTDIDLVLLGTVKTNTSAITALSSAEQTALADYVDIGGCALLMPDNDGFGGGNDPVNESLIDAFGLDITGELIGSQIATVGAVPHPATNGIDTYEQRNPGWFDFIGQGTTLATNSGGSALVTIPAGGLGPGSGPVFAYSDANQFFGSGFAGKFDNPSNRQLFLQSVDACGTEPTPPSTVN